MSETEYYDYGKDHSKHVYAAVQSVREAYHSDVRPDVYSTTLLKTLHSNGLALVDPEDMKLREQLGNIVYELNVEPDEVDAQVDMIIHVLVEHSRVACGFPTST